MKEIGRCISSLRFIFARVYFDWSQFLELFWQKVQPSAKNFNKAGTNERKQILKIDLQRMSLEKNCRFALFSLSLEKGRQESSAFTNF